MTILQVQKNQNHFSVWLHLELRQSSLWTKKQVWPQYFLVLRTASQLPVSATPMSTHAIQIKRIELFQIYMTITKRRRWPFNDFYRLHCNLDLSCLQESDVLTAKGREQGGTQGMWKLCRSYASNTWYWCFYLKKVTYLWEWHTELIVSWYSITGPAEKLSRVQISPWRIAWNSPRRESHKTKDTQAWFQFKWPSGRNTRQSRAHKTNFIS